MSKKPKKDPKINIEVTLERLYQFEVYDGGLEKYVMFTDFDEEDLDLDICGGLTEKSKRRLFKLNKKKTSGKFENLDLDDWNMISNADYLFSNPTDLTIENLNLNKILPHLNRIFEKNKGNYDRIELNLNLGGEGDVAISWLPKIVGIRKETDDEYKARMEKMQQEYEENQRKKEERKKGREKKKVEKVEKLRKELAELEKDIDK